MNTRGQAEALSLILIVAILLVVIILTYVWGRGLFESQRTRSTVDYVTSKLFEIRGAILAVSHEGVNSSRVVQLDVPVGELIVLNGTFCSSNRMSENLIAFNITTTSKLIESEDWISIDPTESNSSCNAGYEGSSASVLMGKTEKIGTSYTNSYSLWLRNLTHSNGASNNFYVINITPGTTTKVSGGSHRVVVRNAGTTNVSYTIYTSIQVDIV